MRGFAAGSLLVVVVALVSYGVWTSNDRNSVSISQAPSEWRAPFVAALSAAAPVSASATPADYERLANLRSDVLAISIGDLTTADGVTTAQDVKMSVKGYEEIGIQIASLTIWSPDAAGIEALIAGNFSDEVVIAERIDAQDIQFFGGEALIQTLNDTAATMAKNGQDAATDPSPEVLAELPEPPTVERFEISMDRLIVDGAMFHGISSASPITEDMGAWEIVQRMAELYRAISIKNIAYDNMYTEMKMFNTDVSMEAIYRLPYVAVRDVARGDIGGVLYEGAEMRMAMSGAELPEGMESFSFGFELNALLAEDLQFAKVLEHLVERQLPPRTETDIMSAGTWAMRGLSINVSEASLFSIDEVDVDLSQFHWLIPTEITSRVRGETYNIEAYADLILSIAKMSADFPPEVQEIVPDVIDVLKDYDLSKIIFDTDTSLQWSPDSGAFGIDSNVKTRGVSEFAFNLDAELPSFAEFDGIDIADEASIQAIFTENVGVNSAAMSLTDRGGIDKAFAIAIDLSEYIPDTADSPQLQMLRQSDPKQLKDGIAALVRLSGLAMKEEFPPGVAFVGAFSDFLLQGGTYKVELAPEAQINFEMISTFSAETGPNEAMDRLGVKVTHTPPAE